MFKNQEGGTESNFWISYADLMAGLLFVFILLIGAIVSKSIILREDLDAKNNSLSAVNQELSIRELALRDAKNDIGNKQSKIKLQKSQLILKREEVAKLRLLVASLESNKEILSQELNQTRSTLEATSNELKQNNVKLASEINKTSSLADDILKLAEEVAEAQKNIKTKDKELSTEKIKISELFAIIDKDKSKYEDVVAKLRKQKAQIKSLTGINLKVIGSLKEKLGDRIDIDQNSGALRLSSNILFDKGSAVLRKKSNSSLKSSFEGYINALLGDKEIKPHIDKIIIEGHTDSDGSYMYNLKLSQDRALAVMSFLSNQNITKKYHLKKYLVASGRAYEDPVMKNNKEDKDASRRIEIKFQLKNQDAMQEIEKILGYEEK